MIRASLAPGSRRRLGSRNQGCQPSQIWLGNFSLFKNGLQKSRDLEQKKLEIKITQTSASIDSASRSTNAPSIHFFSLRCHLTTAENSFWYGSMETFIKSISGYVVISHLNNSSSFMWKNNKKEKEYKQLTTYPKKQQKLNLLTRKYALTSAIIE